MGEWNSRSCDRSSHITIGSLALPLGVVRVDDLIVIIFIFIKE